MSRSRVSLTGALALSSTAAATTWIAMLSWRDFTLDDEGFLVPLLVVGAAIALTGATARWRRLPGSAVVALQVVVSLAVTAFLVAGTLAPAEVLTRLDAAVDAANTYASPVPHGDGISVHPLLIVGGLGSMLLVDLLACTLRRVPLAGLPLLTVYSVPVGLLDGGLAWWVFAVSAVGFLVMLYLQEQDQVGRWGRTLDELAAGPASVGATTSRRRTTARRSVAVRVSATAIGAAAVAAAVVIPTVVPTLDLEVFSGGNGPGGDSEITINNPIVDLRRDLKRGEDVPLIDITTDDPDPSYLRISVLNRFSDNMWSSGDRDVPTAQRATGEELPLMGVSESVPRREYDYDVSIADAFESTWLPTQAPISSITADGDWRWDAATMDFIASEDDLTTAGVSYSMTAVDLDVTSQDLASARGGAAGLSPEVLAVPVGLPTLISDLAESVTERADTPYLKAVALQQWFREDGGFRYSLEDSSNGNGADDLEAFLREGGRVGYCEQFAASMAVMARVLDIPARVAVGFLEPDRVGPGRWQYSAHDLHAWPELYFPGAGWVRFEPTPGGPGGRAQSVPDYTRTAVDVGPDIPTDPVPSTSAAPEETTVPSAAPTTQAPEQAAPETGSAGAGSAFPWGRVLLALGVVLLVAALLALPRALRRRRRAARLAGGPEAAWDELRAVVVDLGLRWPDRRSPRETAGVVVDWLAVSGDGEIARPGRGRTRAPEAAAALDRIVAALERSRYSRTPSSDLGLLRDDVVTCSDALVAGVAPNTRRRAEWLPRSVWSRQTRFVDHTADAAGGDAGSYGRMVEHI